MAALSPYADITVADITRQGTISEMADDILAACPNCFSLAGFSLGSQVALEIMSRSKDRIERLALLSATRGGLLPPVENAIRHAISVIEGGGLDDYLDAAYPTYVAGSHAQNVSLKRSFTEMAHAVGSEAGLRQMRALLAIATPFDSLNQINCRTVIIGGRQDLRTTPGAHEVLATEIPESTLVMIEDAAHFTPLEQPEVVTGVLLRWMTD